MFPSFYYFQSASYIYRIACLVRIVELGINSFVRKKIKSEATHFAEATNIKIGLKI